MSVINAVSDKHQENVALTVPVKDFATSARLDKVGATASLLCAVHCAAMPLLLTLLPLVGLSFFASQWMEWLLVVFSAALGTASLCLGYREHKSRRAFAVLSGGLALLALGRIMEQWGIGGFWGVVIVVCGGLTVASAHFLNRRLCESCHACHTHQS